MAKIVFRAESPQIAADSFAAKPKVLYLLGKTQGRVEEEYDPALGLQALTIVDGKDLWMINKTLKTGRHLVDPSSDHDFHVPLVPGAGANSQSPLSGFEEGKEIAFMTDHHVTPQTVTKDGKSLTLYEYIQDDYTLQFYVSPDTQVPVQCVVLKGKDTIVHLIYTEYTTSLPADPSLFQPPADIKITEG